MKNILSIIGNTLIAVSLFVAGLGCGYVVAVAQYGVAGKNGHIQWQNARAAGKTVSQANAEQIFEINSRL